MTIKDHPPSRQPLWRLIAQEVAAVAGAGLLTPLGLLRRSSTTPRQREQRTVVMIHGYLANRSTLAPLALYLRVHGHRSILFFDYASGEGVDRAARGLREHLKRHVRGGRIDLVCHSMGGLVARVYLQDLGGSRRVDRCITLGTPHHGTYNAYWVPSRVGRELRPDSDLLARVDRTADQAGAVRFLSITAGSDNIVVPRVFSAHIDEVHLPDVGHLGILFSPRVFRLVRDFLRQPVPVGPSTRGHGAA